MILIGVIFIAVLAGTTGVFFLLDGRMRKSEVNSIKSRLLGSGKAKKGKTSDAPALMQSDVPQGRLALELLNRLRLQERLQRLLERAGLRWTVTRFVHTSLAALLVGLASGWLLAPPPYNRLAPLLGLVLGLAPLVYALRKSKRRLRKFEEQFPDSLEFVARSMRAGHAFSVSLEMIHQEFDEPLGGEFRRTFDEQNLGLPLDVALEKLAARMPLLDVQFFVSAVLLQKRTGGNLAEVLEKIAYLIRERFKLRGRIRAVSAHGRMTGMVLTLIPLGVGVLMFFVNPLYVLFFFHDPTGHLMLGGALILQLIGFAVIKKIVTIEV